MTTANAVKEPQSNLVSESYLVHLTLYLYKILDDSIVSPMAVFPALLEAK